ncbi:MAG: DUF4395 family protein [Vicinamibacteria bacterium]
MSAELNFVRQQGFRDASASSCGYQYEALMVQPRVIGVLILAGVLLQHAPFFLALGALLWWNAVVPRLNPFDWLSNQLVAKRKGRPALGPAPAPRRFAQGMAGSFLLGIGGALLTGHAVVAAALEALLLAALGALVFGRFCLGSYVFHLLRGQAGFAQRTLPWSRTQ